MLINLRNALMAGERLPYDAEVEYLESTGMQYIDTLVNADSNLSVEITMANIGTPWNNVNPGGAILATPRCMHHINFENVIYYYFGNGDNCNANSAYRPTDGEIFTYKVDATSKTFTLGSFLGTFPNDTFDTGLSYWLFGRNGTTPPYLGSLRIYSAKLWNGNILVRDYIPVRKGTVGYLYDRVSGKIFGNAGTGDFVLGPDVVPVEWLESHGTEYIDTGIKPSLNTSVETVFAMTTFTVNCGLFGARGNASAYNNSYNLFIINNNGYRVRWDWSGSGQYQTTEAETSTVATYVLGAAGGTITRNGTTVMSVSASKAAINYPLYIFNFNNVGTPFSTGANARFWSVKIYDGQTLVNSFRPVRVGTDATSWEGAMMDTLTRRIYRNAGTGAFTYGNDLKYPIPA